MTHHFAMTSLLRIKILKMDKFGVFSSDIDFKTKIDIFRDDISRLINQFNLQATEGSLRRTRRVRKPRSASKRSALVLVYIYIHINRVLIVRIYIYICNELIEETAGCRRLIFGMWESFGYGSSKF